MNTTIIKKFIGKNVMLFISGISHIGVLADAPNEGVVILNCQNRSNIGELYVLINSIDAICEYSPPIKISTGIDTNK